MNVQTASRDELLAYIATLEAAVAALEARVRELEARGGEGAPRRMPGHKPEQRAAGAARPRKPRARGYGRCRSVPTEQVVHAVAQCPACGCALVGGSRQRSREVLELAPAPARVSEHVYLARRCPQCGRRCVPPPELAGVVVGRQRLGVGLVSLIATLRCVGRWPYGQIQRYLASVHGLRLSQGALVGAVRTVARQGAGAAAQIQEQVRASPVVHGDETGWRENGRNGDVWTFSTPTARLFVRGSRTGSVIDAALGGDFAGVLVSDFYAAYDHVPTPQRRCWAHLLRDVHALRQQHPDDVALATWATQLHRLYERGRAGATGPTPGPRAAQRRQWALRTRLQAELRARATLPPTEPPPVWRTLAGRLQRYEGELFTFVTEPGVPPDNNAAERSLRPLVTQRKISGGTRSSAGTTTLMVASTLFGTWLAQRRDPLPACRHLLALPQV
ncbi:MAG TPA: IS66 family transposase [Chloroflexota bacterium]|nr:IS66 family transposase [Chloroflexota bacterium]